MFGPSLPLLYRPSGTEQLKYLLTAAVVVPPHKHMHTPYTLHRYDTNYDSQANNLCNNYLALSLCDLLEVNNVKHTIKIPGTYNVVGLSSKPVPDLPK